MEDSASTRIMLVILMASALAQAQTVTEYPVPTAKSSPNGITAGPDGALWFTENVAGKIGRITTAGVITEYPLSPAYDPCCITTGPDGALWFIDHDNSTPNIGRITTSGAITQAPDQLTE